MKQTLKKILVIVAELGFPLTIASTVWLKIIRKVGIGNFTDKIFMFFGILPVQDHYYQPLINPRKYLKNSLRVDRHLPAIDFNINEQLDILAQFNYNDELLTFPIKKTKDLEFYYNNRAYESGDAEYLYNIIRLFKPARIIEIGSGYSTLMTRNAIKNNKLENPQHECSHVCIEPYEMPWLNQLDIQLRKELVENTDIKFFQELDENDILFIDSSHIIRPQGDVLYEFLEILPSLKDGVIVHIHDIFTPKDYLDVWVKKQHRLWNEQYLLETFLSFNNEFRIIGSLNHLSHEYKENFQSKCPIYAKQTGREPGSFWIKKQLLTKNKPH